MRLPSDIFLALRYMRPRRSLVSVITLLSVIGPALGVAVLIVVTAVFDGFDRDMKQRILGLQAHLVVYPRAKSYFEPIAIISDTDAVSAVLERKGLQTAPLIEDMALIQFHDNIEIKSMRGIVPQREVGVSELRDSIVAGTWNIAPGEALIGIHAASALGIGIGDRILIHSPRRMAENIDWSETGEISVQETKSVYLPEEVTIAGLFSFGIYAFDSSMIYVHIDQAADVLALDWGSATSVHCRGSDPFAVDELANKLRPELDGYHVSTWQEENERLFGALEVEKRLTTFLLFFIIIVAAFSIAGTLITSAVQKTREIGILKAIGIGPGAIARIFMIQGAVIGMLGTIMGTATGFLIIHFRDKIADLLAKVIGHEVFPPELYHLQSIPAWLTAKDAIAITGLAFIICIAAALLPALYASSLHPAQALAEE